MVMLPVSLRLDLRDTPDFFSQARSCVQPHLRLLYRQHAPSTGLQAAVVVSKKHGKAAQRNKTKRWLRNAIIALEKEEPTVFALPYSLVILVKGPPQTYASYDTELRQLLACLAQRHEK